MEVVFEQSKSEFNHFSNNILPEERKSNNSRLPYLTSLLRSLGPRTRSIFSFTVAPFKFPKNCGLTKAFYKKGQYDDDAAEALHDQSLAKKSLNDKSKRGTNHFCFETLINLISFLK